MIKEVFIHAFSIIGLGLIVSLLNVVTPEDCFLGLEIGSIVLKSIDCATVGSKISNIYSKK